MRRTLTRIAAVPAAIFALAQPQIAMAQNCVDQENISDAMIYSMPLLVSAFAEKCGDELADSGFMSTKGDAFAAQYLDRQDAVWPGAFTLLMQFAAKDGDEAMANLFAALPEESVRPLVDAIIEQKVAEEIKLKDCAKIERGVEMLAPLPPENMGGLLAFLMDMANVKDPKICAYEPK
ncbi:hypothetical protein [Pontixanthobacter sp.]|uniref:hypothetical protein n=1 Tax=Pontixanthobacter sp. TaxID=2792078 RepID=UPI003C7A4E35